MNRSPEEGIYIMGKVPQEDDVFLTIAFRIQLLFRSDFPAQREKRALFEPIQLECGGLVRKMTRFLKMCQQPESLNSGKVVQAPIVFVGFQ